MTACKTANCVGWAVYRCPVAASSFGIELHAVGISTQISEEETQRLRNEINDLSRLADSTCIRADAAPMRELVERYPAAERVTIVMRWPGEATCHDTREIRIDAERVPGEERYGIHMHSFPVVSTAATGR